MAIDNAEVLDLTFRALGDGTRRAMLSRLRAQGECSAGEFVEMFNSAQPTISKHLRVLEQAGLVDRRVEGRNHIFKLKAHALEQAETWLHRHRTFWENSLDRLATFLGDDEEKEPI